MINRTHLLPMAFCGALLSACSSDDPVTDEDAVLIWRSCPEDATLECATLRVPMNYQDDEAGQIDIALNRLPASQQPASGSLLLNPGGPGASGIEVLEILTEIETFPEAVRQRYDLIGFDPRGMGSSTPVDCDAFDVTVLGDYLQNASDISEFVQVSTEAAEQCHALEGDYLLQLGSMNVVRDMESIRKALNVPKIDFLGYSYGTRLAALYLQTYPDTSGAFILDGSVRPISSVASLAEGALPVMQMNLESMLQNCAITEPDCDPAQLQDLLNDRIATLLSENREAEFELLGDLVFEATQDPLLGEMLIAPLSSYLLRDDTAGIELLAQLLQPGEEDDDEDNDTAQKAVLCADDAYRPTESDLIAQLSVYNTVSDIFAEAFIGMAGTCAGWPASIEALPPIATGTAPMALVIGGTTDAQTPLAWSEEMANAIGGHYLASSHQGHTSVYNEESDCVDDKVTTFLLDGLLPGAADCL